MRKVRTLVALLTVAALLLSFGGIAGAASFSDVPANASYAAQVSLLADLKVVQGYPDGTFGPDDLLTREQFAVFVIRALGRDKMAQSFAEYATSFKDDGQIASWARGHVFLASSLRIIGGYPDGTFGPKKYVTYAEALAMLVRALGFEKYAKDQGTWPAGYLIAAEKLGLDKGIAAVPNLPIVRADMAVATYNAIVANVKADANGAPVPGDSGGADSLLVKVFKYTAAQYNALVSPTKTVSGTFKSYLSLSGRIDVGGTLYELASSYTVKINGATKAIGDLTNGDSVTLTLDSAGKVTAISATRTTLANVELTGVTVATGETAYGEITVAGKTYAITVDRGTSVTVDGKAGTLADAKAALDALRASYAGKNGLVTVVTEGNYDSNDPAIGKAKALSISVITTNVVTGTITAAGNDSGGDYVRVQPDGATDTVKLYYSGLTLGAGDFAVGNKLTMLKGSDDKIRVVLKLHTQPGPSVFWAHVLGIEKNASSNLVSITVHTEKMDSPATATYAGAKNNSGAYSVAAGTYAANSVLAVEVSGGVVTKLSGTGSEVSANLKSGTAAGAAVLISGSVYSVTVGSDTVYIDASKAIFLQSNGQHSTRRASAIGNTTTIYYYFDGSKNVAQVVQFGNND